MRRAAEAEGISKEGVVLSLASDAGDESKDSNDHEEESSNSSHADDGHAGAATRRRGRHTGVEDELGEETQATTTKS
jgi:hypothetical protein